MMLRMDKEKVLPKFFLYQLLSPLIQDDHIAPLSKGSAAPHLNIGSLRKFPFRLPSLGEQSRIVGELDELRTEVDALSASRPRRILRSSTTAFGAIEGFRGDSTMWSDNESTEDLLGFQYLADAVVSIVKNENLLPATIGVFGDWGGGKSTLIEIVRTQLTSEAEKQAGTRHSFFQWMAFRGL